MLVYRPPTPHGRIFDVGYNLLHVWLPWLERICLSSLLIAFASIEARVEGSSFGRSMNVGSQHIYQPRVPVCPNAEQLCSWQSTMETPLLARRLAFVDFIIDYDLVSKNAVCRDQA